MTFDTFSYTVFSIIGIVFALFVFGFFIPLFWDEVLKPSIYGPNGTWRKLSSILIVLLIFSASIAAQQTNLHGDIVVQTSNNLGARPAYGASIGGDLRKDRIVLSLDATVLRIHKPSYGLGWSEGGRESVRLYFGRYLFAQGLMNESHYSAGAIAKSSIDVGGGVGFSTTNAVLQANYRQTVWEDTTPKGGDNHTRIFEGRFQYFGKHHVYIEARGDVVSFRNHPPSGIRQETGSAFTVGVGFWK